MTAKDKTDAYWLRCDLTDARAAAEHFKTNAFRLEHHSDPRQVDFAYKLKRWAGAIERLADKADPAKRSSAEQFFSELEKVG